MPLEFVRDDITRMDVDAIVNAANRSLLGGGGVDGAIHRAAGPELKEECRALGGCETGRAKVTRGYRLKAKYVIHTVGPIWQGGGCGEREALSACYRNSLALAQDMGCASVAFPLISAGAYGYPKAEAMGVAVDEITRFLQTREMTVYLVLFGETEFLTGKALYRDVKEYIDRNYAETHIKKNVEARRSAAWRQGEEEGLAIDRALMMEATPAPAPAASKPLEETDWEELLRQTDEGFSETLLRLIDQKGIPDTECYKRANVDRKLFSKIRSNPAYRPKKQTVFAFAVALELDLRETRMLLERAGFALSHSSRFDLVMEYCIRNRRYDVFEINQILFQLDMPLLGSCMA